MMSTGHQHYFYPRFTYKDKTYSKIQEAKIKCRRHWWSWKRKWWPVVIYQAEYINPDGKTWVRFKDEFEKLFKPII